MHFLSPQTHKMKKDDFSNLENETKEEAQELAPMFNFEKIKCFFSSLGRSKTSFCRHNGACLSNCIIGGLKSFYLGFLIRIMINFLALIFFQKQQRKNLVFYIMAFFQKSNFQLGGFFGFYAFLNKFVLCFLRRIKNDDAGINAFLSGAIAGFCSLYTQPKSSWYMWRVYLWARAFDTIYQQLLRKKIINDHFWNWGLIMGTFNTIIVYAFLQEPEALPRDVLKLYFKFSFLNTNELLWRDGAMEWRKRLLQSAGLI